VRLGVGSGYRPYEFEGLGRDFEGRRDIVEEAIGLMFDAWHRHRWDHKGRYFSGTVQGEYEMLPHPIQMPHPPLYMAGGTDRSIGYSGRNGFGLMLSTLPGVETLAAQTSLYLSCHLSPDVSLQRAWRSKLLTQGLLPRLFLQPLEFGSSFDTELSVEV